MRAAIIVCLFLLSAIVTISANLQSDIEDVASQLPMKEINSIGKQYVRAYPNYASGLRYVEKVTYEHIVKNFLTTQMGQNFKEYFRSRRGIDIEPIWLNLTGNISSVIHEWLEPQMEGDNAVRTVISGNIIKDIKKACAKSGFLDIALRKIESSPEFANLVVAFKDPEYLAIFYVPGNYSEENHNNKKIEARGFWSSTWKKFGKIP